MAGAKIQNGLRQKVVQDRIWVFGVSGMSRKYIPVLRTVERDDPNQGSRKKN